MNRKLIPYGTKLPVAFTNKELDDIRSCIMIGEEFGRHAVVDGKRFRLNLSLDDIEDLQGHVAAEANHTRDAKLRNRLDKIFLKLQGFLDRYDDSMTSRRLLKSKFRFVELRFTRSYLNELATICANSSSHRNRNRRPRIESGRDLRVVLMIVFTTVAA
jgi:hypothetical protein